VELGDLHQVAHPFLKVEQLQLPALFARSGVSADQFAQT